MADKEFDFATLGDIDLVNFSPEEEALAIAKGKDAKSAELVKEYSIALDRAVYAATGGKVITKPRVAKTAVAPITQDMWNCRMAVFMALIESPERALKGNPIAVTWKELYSNREYGNWVSSAPIGRFDKPKLREALKKAGIKKRGQLQTVADFIRIIKEHAKTELNHEMSKRIKSKGEGIRSLEIHVDSSTGAIWYKGIEIQRLKERFKVEIGGKPLSMRHGAFDKVEGFFNQIDILVELSQEE